jgi:nucleoside-diphosphate-sugar epimerase
MRILVIGGTGFIGRFVVPPLQNAGHTVAVFHRATSAGDVPAGVRTFRGDRHNLAAHRVELRAFAPDVVIDMIASSGAHARALMDVFRGVACRLVVLSSMDVYRAVTVLHGLDSGPLEPLPLTEESPLRATTQAYPAERLRALQRVFGWLDEAYDKVAVERALEQDPELPATVLRLPMVYGPGDPLHRFFPVLKRILDGRRVIPLEERVARWRGPRGFVENVAAAIVLAAMADGAEGWKREPAQVRVYNVGEAEAFSELEWARLISEAAGWRGKLVVLPTERAPAHLLVPGNLEQHWVADTSRIRAELGYSDPVPRAEALRRTIEWERSHPPAEYDPAQFDYAAEDAALNT